MKPIMRKFQQDDDYWRIRAFLRKVLLLNDREQKSWDVARFDYWRWHGILNMNDGTLEDDVFIWENGAGDIIAVLNREAPGSVFLQVHPQCRTDQLEAEMLAVAELYLAVTDNSGQRSLHVWARKDDISRQETLKKQGYHISEKHKSEHQRRRFFSEPIASMPVAEGYIIRSMGDIDEHRKKELASWRAFHPDESDEGFEPGWYRNVQRAPLYRRDLDIVAVAPDGEYAAFCTIWFDDVLRTGHFEPVGTAPQHQRRGLGTCLLTEGLIRLRGLGGDLAYVGSYAEPAHTLYKSAGFETYSILEPWIKEV
ncbi:MAG: GNAT family N-acetyltransferase [candidate division Zixibacteria bacterium]|nr:GNAT family N-acetyltransferase [candidate division Zixibacteria bacterium]